MGRGWGVRRWPLAAGAVAVLGSVVVAASGGSPLPALTAAVEGALGSWTAVQETLARATPLLWCGLAVTVAFRAGVWNIGGEGQLLAGALAATWTALALPPGPAAAAVSLVAGAGGGAAWAWVAAALARWRGVNEVLSTILLNLVAEGIVAWMVRGPLQEAAASYPQSDPVPHATWLWRPWPPGRLHLGLALAVAVAVAVAVALRWSAGGLELRAAGDGPGCATAVGIPVARVRYRALVVSGALAGFGGAVELLGIAHRLYERFSPGYGYAGIAVALVGGLAPGGTVAAAVAFGAMGAGAGAMQRVAGVPTVAVLLLEGVVIVLLAVGRRR